VGTAALQAVGKILWRLATKEFIEWAIMYAAEAAAKHTDTPHDDAFLAKVREANEAAKSGTV